MVSGLTGLAGIIVLAFVLQRLAEWVRDDLAEKAFAWTIWGLPVFGVLNAVLPSILIVSILVLLLLVVSVGSFPFGVLSLSRSIEYSVRHAREQEARDRRRAERLRRYDEQVAQRVSSIDKARERSDST